MLIAKRMNRYVEVADPSELPGLPRAALVAVIGNRVFKRQWMRKGRGFAETTTYMGSGSYIGPHAILLENAKLFDRARLEDYAIAYGDAEFHGRSSAMGNTLVFGGKFHDNVRLEGHTLIRGSPELYNDVRAIDAYISDGPHGSPKLYGSLLLRDGVEISDAARIIGNHQVLAGNITVSWSPHQQVPLRRPAPPET